MTFSSNKSCQYSKMQNFVKHSDGTFYKIKFSELENLDLHKD